MNIPPEQQFRSNPSLYSDLGPQLIRYVRQLEHSRHMTTLRPIQFEHIQRTMVKLIDPTGQKPDQEIPKRETLTLTGHFHSFSTEGDGQESGPVAIIETPDGQIYTPSAHKCKFLDTQPLESSVKTSDTI